MPNSSLAAHMPLDTESTLNPALNFTAKAWFSVAMTGQWILAAYVAIFYGTAALQGNFTRWNDVLPVGYIAGDTAGNLGLGLHLLFAVYILLAAPIQILPWVRNNLPSLHRWNGRIYIFSALLLGMGGAFLIWTRGASGDLGQHIGITLNAILIVWFGITAGKYALQRRFKDHRRWALRLFFAVSGVWFFRVGLMFWMAVNQGPVGFDPLTFTGPFLTFLAFAQTLLPLALLELYFHARESREKLVKVSSISLTWLATLATAMGVAMASYAIWLPRIM